MFHTPIQVQSFNIDANITNNDPINIDSEDNNIDNNNAPTGSFVDQLHSCFMEVYQGEIRSDTIFNDEIAPLAKVQTIPTETTFKAQDLISSNAEAIAQKKGIPWPPPFKHY